MLSTACSSIKHCPTPVICCSSFLSTHHHFQVFSQVKATYPFNLSKLPVLKTKTMKFTLLTTLLISAASARQFILFDNANYGGASHTENRNNDNACWNLNGKGDRHLLWQMLSWWSCAPVKTVCAPTQSGCHCSDDL